MTVKKSRKIFLKSKLSGKNKYLDKMINDSQYRFLATSAFSGGWNFVYALFHFVLAAWFRSLWFFTMGLYYLIACAMRASALHLSGKAASEYAAIRRNAALTFVLALIFTGVIGLTIAERHNSVYSTIVAITMALYTFYCITMAILNMIRMKKQRNVQTILLRNVSMLYALGAMFGLERMMLGSFGNAASHFTLVMEAASGAGFCLLIITFGMNLVLLSSKAKSQSL